MKIRALMTMMLVSLLVGAQTLAAATWDSYFPTDKPHTAKVMALQFDQQAQQILVKMQAAIAKDPAWFKKAIAEAPAGQPMPYDKRLGITEAEYRLLLAEGKPTLKQTGTVMVTFKKTDETHIEITTDEETPINGIVVSAEEVTTPLGVLNTKDTVNNTDVNSATGAWEGVEWKFTNLDEQTMEDKKLEELEFKSLKFAVGTLKVSGEHIIYYDAKDIDPKASRRTEITYILYY